LFDSREIMARIKLVNIFFLLTIASFVDDFLGAIEQAEFEVLEVLVVVQIM